jgi:hypothetical protein
MHAVLCQLGLPRNPTPSKTFERSSGRAHLSLQAGRWFNGMKFIDQPLPSGTRPRLVLINLCSEAVRTRDRHVNIGGSVREFLRRLNIDPGGESMAQFRKQMLALSCCRMTLAMVTADGPAQVNAEPIEGFQAWHTDEDGQQTLWPGYIRLTEKFFESLMDHAVPLETEAIGRLQNSAFALDVYSWLAHRLWRVNDPQGVTVSWGALKEQFGQEYSDTRNFRRRFLGALKNATGAYQDARIECVKGGLRLLPSPPPVKRMVVSVAVPGEIGADENPGKRRALPPPPSPLPDKSGRVPRSARGGSLEGEKPIVAEAPPSSIIMPERLVSERALEQVPGIAPGWDKYALAERYKAWVADKGEMPRYPDAAFLGWVRNYTKGKRV